MATIHDLTYGAEIEITGNTRCACARVLQEFFGRAYVHEGTHYDKYSVTDNQGRKWTAMSDASITPLKKVNGHIVGASDLYKVELVTPPLHYSELPMLQELIRKLRKAGFFESESCGLHIHIGLQSVQPQTIVHILNQIHSKQELIFKALGVSTSTGRYRFCKKIPTALVETLKKKKAKTLKQIADVWYSTIGHSGERYTRYPSSRYHIVNLTRGLVPDSQYYYGTCEFRCFSSTLHAGKIKAYIQLCLLLVAYCSTLSKSSYKPYILEEGCSAAYGFRVWLLKLGCIGPEFKTMRTHLLDRFGTQSKAWRRGDRTSA